MYDVRFTAQAKKDAVKIERVGLKPQTSQIIITVRNNPYEKSQRFEKLKGDLKGLYSRRINGQHRFVYQILSNDEGAKNGNGELYEGIVKIISMWTHYE